MAAGLDHRTLFMCSPNVLTGPLFARNSSGFLTILWPSFAFFSPRGIAGSLKGREIDRLLSQTSSRLSPQALQAGGRNCRGLLSAMPPSHVVFEPLVTFQRDGLRSQKEAGLELQLILRRRGRPRQPRRADRGRRRHRDVRASPPSQEKAGEKEGEERGGRSEGAAQAPAGKWRVVIVRESLSRPTVTFALSFARWADV